MYTHSQSDSSHSGPENVATVEQWNESHQVDSGPDRFRIFTLITERERLQYGKYCNRKSLFTSEQKKVGFQQQLSGF